MRSTCRRCAPVTSRVRPRSRRSARRAWERAAAQASTRCARRCRTPCAVTATRSSTTAGTPTSACGRCSASPRRRGRSCGSWTRERRGRAHVQRAARDGVEGIERSSVDGEDDARCRELRRARRAALDRERQDPARPRRPEDEGEHGEDRRARARVRAHADQGSGRRRDDEHGDSLQLERCGGRRHGDEVGRRGEARRTRRFDGAARAPADREPAGPARARRARAAGERSAGARLASVPVPFRIGVMQLTMEPLDEMLASAHVMDEAGLDTIWLAEAYPWWRKHGMEARSSTVVSALMARETTRLTIGWGIISPFTRHPVQVAMDARVVQEAAGTGRFILGFGTSKIFLNNAGMHTSKTLGPMRDAVEIVRGVLGGQPFEYEGSTWNASVPGMQADAHAPREIPPVYVAATAPKMQALAGEVADGCLTPSITTPPFVRYTRKNVVADIDIGCTVVASIHASDRDAGRDGAREIAGMYLANKVQNIKGAADTLLDLAGIEQEEIRPVAEAMERGGRLAAKAEVSDALLDKCKPIAGTPEDCIEAIEEYRDSGCTHVMLELWGDRRPEQIRLFGERVMPHLRG